MKPTLHETAYVLVDDDDDDRFLMRQALQKHMRPLPVLEFEDGQAFIDYLQANTLHNSNLPPRWLVILDVNMPRLNGFDTVSLLRNNPQWNTLPVLMLSTSDSPSMVEEARQRGANAYVAKPTSQSGYAQIFDRYVAPFLAMSPGLWPAYTKHFWSTAITPGAAPESAVSV